MSVQCLLKKQTGGSVLGWQSPQLSKRKSMFNPLPPKIPFIQILHVNGNHWVTVSNMKPKTSEVYPDTVCLYDSNWTEKSTVSLVTMQHICSFFKSDAATLYFDFVNVDRQSNSSDCGVYALAFAAELAHGGDPALFTWDVNNMRGHILNSMRTGFVPPFPKKDERKIRFGKRIRISHAEPIYCACKMPNDGLEYIKCSGCRGWFHMSCVCLNTDRSYRNVKWSCTDCTKVFE